MGVICGQRVEVWVCRGCGLWVMGCIFDTCCMVHLYSLCFDVVYDWWCVWVHSTRVDHTMRRGLMRV